MQTRVGVDAMQWKSHAICAESERRLFNYLRSVFGWNPSDRHLLRDTLNYWSRSPSCRDLPNNFSSVGAGDGHEAFGMHGHRPPPT